MTETQIRVRDTPHRRLMQIDDFQNGRLNGRVSPFNIGTCLIIHCPYHDYRSFIFRLRVEKPVGYQSVYRLKINQGSFCKNRVLKNVDREKMSQSRSDTLLPTKHDLYFLCALNAERFKSSFVLSHTIFYLKGNIQLRNLGVRRRVQR